MAVAAAQDTTACYPPLLWLLPQQQSRAIGDLPWHQTGGRSLSPRACSAELDPSLSSRLGLAYPGAGLCICCCWTSHGSCKPVSPAYPSPSEEQPWSPAY